MSVKKEPTGLQRNISFRTLTTFKIGGLAKYFLTVNNKEQIIEAMSWARENSLPFFILAGGSNLLVSDRGFKGLVIRMKNEKLKIKNDNLGCCNIYSLQPNAKRSKSKIIYCEAGVRLSDLVRLSVDEGLGGLEWAAGIPQATVGGAIWGNAGAFGKTMGEVVKKVEVMQVQSSKLSIRADGPIWGGAPTGRIGSASRISKVQSYKNKECEFEYKDSVFKRNKSLIILSADLVLEKKSKEEVHEEVKKNLKYRKEHHPIEPSAGSVFKNLKIKSEQEKIFLKFPEAKIFEAKGEIPAGWLIEQCGLKGKKIGGAQISPKHTNFIVNTGSSSAVDVAALIKLAQQKVKERFDIILEKEIQYFKF